MLKKLLAVALLLVSFSALAEAQQMKACVLVSVVNTDTKNQLRALMNDLSNYVIGRDVDPASGDFQRYVIGVNGVAALSGTNPKTGAPLEVEAGGAIGANQDVSQNVAVELAKIGSRSNLLGAQIAFNPPFTRAQQREYLINVAGYIGCTHYWFVIPGDNVTVTNNADLLAKFTPIGQ